MTSCLCELFPFLVHPMPKGAGLRCVTKVSRLIWYFLNYLFFWRTILASSKKPLIEFYLSSIFDHPKVFSTKVRPTKNIGLSLLQILTHNFIHNDLKNHVVTICSWNSVGDLEGITHNALWRRAGTSLTTNLTHLV